MNDFNNFILSKGEINDSYLLVPNPFINDVYDIIIEFNKKNSEIKQGLVFMDLQTIVGNRKKKFVSYEVLNYKIQRNSKTMFSDISIQNELKELKVNFYKKINHNTLSGLIKVNSQQQLLN